MSRVLTRPTSGRIRTPPEKSENPPDIWSVYLQLTVTPTHGELNKTSIVYERGEYIPSSYVWMLLEPNTPILLNYIPCHIPTREAATLPSNMSQCLNSVILAQATIK